MGAHGMEYGERVGIGKQNLEGVSGHDNEVEAQVRFVILRRALDPLNFVRPRLFSGHREHRPGWIRSRDVVTAGGQRAAKRAGTTAEIEHADGMRTGEGDVKVGIRRR